MNQILSSFAELRLRPAVYDTLARMGIHTPTPIQASAIPPLLDGRDVVGQARTGSGKTLAYVLPIVERLDPRPEGTRRGVQALVLVPTRELAIQVGDVFAQVAPTRGLRVTLLYGGRSLLPEAQALRSGVHVVVGTPGRTLDHLRQRNLSLGGLRILVLDEGDEMLDRGFAPDVERIIAHTPPQRQTALFSATLPPWVATTAAKHLREPVEAKVDRDVDAPPEIEHVVYEMASESKLSALRSFLDARGDGPIIVFGRTKHGVKKLAKQLAAFGYPAAALQGNMSQNARERTMASFRSGELPILLATNVAARGIDVSGVDRVINYELPESAELFTHRAGRTGRMGRAGEAVTFVTPEDDAKWRQIERALGKRLRRERWPGLGQPGERPALAVGERRSQAAGRLTAGSMARPASSARTPSTASAKSPKRRWSAGSSPRHHATRKSGRETSSQA